MVAMPARLVPSVLLTDTPPLPLLYANACTAFLLLLLTYNRPLPFVLLAWRPAGF